MSLDMMSLDIMVDELNTPIKKIKNLSIASPDIKRIMVEKGYSNSISDKVLNEMNIKLSQSGHQYGSSPMSDNEIHIDNVDMDELDRLENQENKFNHIHKDYFNKMESIMNHYSIKRDTSELLNSKKKRRTLTGIEESPVHPPNHYQADSPYRPPSRNPRGQHPRLMRSKLSPTKIPNMSLSSVNNSFNSPHHLPPNPLPNSENNGSPIQRSEHTNLLPIRASPSRISPSRKSYNINGMLTRKISVPRSRSPSRDSPTRPNASNTSNNDFKQPKNFHKINSQPTAIPKLTPNQPSLQKKSSIPTLNHSNLPKKPSIPSFNTLQKKSSIPTLQKKSSIPTLQSKPSIPTLQSKPSIPTLKTKSSIPTLNSLQKKPSIPTLPQTNSLNKKPSTTSLRPPAPLLSRPSSSSLKPPMHQSNSNSLRQKPSTTFDQSILRKSSVPNLNGTKKPLLYTSASSSSLNSNKTYDKPTVSSSQKSLDKFSRFKTKFQ